MNRTFPSMGIVRQQDLSDRKERKTIEHNNHKSEAVRPSRTEYLNTALYQKMYAAQEKYREWLILQTPEEVLNHAYEYTMREDILIWVRYNGLKPAQAKTLLRLPDPLDAVFQDLNHRENSHMDDIADVIEDRANREIARRHEKQPEYCR